MTLFKALMASIYAVDGADGEFLADLTRPIPYVKSTSEVREGVLAHIPAARHADLVHWIGWHETAISEEITFAMEDQDDFSEETLIEILTSLDHPTEAAKQVQILRTDLRELRLELAAL